MGSLGTRGIGMAGMVGMMLLLNVGCASSTRIAFNGPPGTVLFVDGKPHHLPAVVEMERARLVQFEATLQKVDEQYRRLG